MYLYNCMTIQKRGVWVCWQHSNCQPTDTHTHTHTNTHTHTHTHTLAVSLFLSLYFFLNGSFNESQFPTARHITPLNDLINQARHLLSLAISLFTIASTAVTQFSFLAPASSVVSLLPWPYRNAMTSPFCYKLSTFPLQSVFTERHHLPLNVRLTGFATVTPPKPRGPVKLSAQLFIGC